MPLLPRLTERDRGSLAAPSAVSGQVPTSASSSPPHRSTSQRGSLTSSASSVLPFGGTSNSQRNTHAVGATGSGPALSPMLLHTPFAVEQKQQQQQSPMGSPGGFRGKLLPARVDIDLRDQRKRVQAYEATRGMQRRAQEYREMAYWEGRREFHALASHCLVEEARNYRLQQLQPRLQLVTKLNLSPSLSGLPSKAHLPRSSSGGSTGGQQPLPPLPGTPITSTSQNGNESQITAATLPPLVVKVDQDRLESGTERNPQPETSIKSTTNTNPPSGGDRSCSGATPRSILPHPLNQFYDEIHRDVEILLSPADPVNRSVSVRRQLAELHLFASPTIS